MYLYCCYSGFYVHYAAAAAPLLPLGGRSCQDDRGLDMDRATTLDGILKPKQDSLWPHVVIYSIRAFAEQSPGNRRKNGTTGEFIEKRCKRTFELI